VPDTEPQRGDRWLILAQLLLGAALVVFGALLAALSKEAVHDIGTAVIGVGAALLPAGVAASASARIRQSQTLPPAPGPQEGPPEASQPSSLTG
jgi:hypothetical protein